LSHKRIGLWLTETDADILRIIGDGSVSAGVRELVVVYRDLWALGYRPTVPVKFFVRRYKKKGPRRAPKEVSDGGPV